MDYCIGTYRATSDLAMSRLPKALLLDSDCSVIDVICTFTHIGTEFYGRTWEVVNYY